MYFASSHNSPAEKRARQRVSQRHFRSRHEAIDQNKQRHRNQITARREHDLPESTAHGRSNVIALDLSRRKPAGISRNATSTEVTNTENESNKPNDPDHSDRQCPAVQERSRRRPPDSIQCAFNDGKDPRAGPQTRSRCKSSIAPNSNLRKRFDRVAQKLDSNRDRRQPRGPTSGCRPRVCCSIASNNSNAGKSAIKPK